MTVGRIALNTKPSADPWEALDALQARFSVPPQPAGSFTLAEYAERYGLPWHTANRALNQMVTGGTLSKQPGIVKGRRVNVYWIPEQPKARKRGQ